MGVRSLTAAVAACVLLGGCLDPRQPRTATMVFAGRLPRGYFLASAAVDGGGDGCDALLAAGLGHVNLRGGVRFLPAEAEEIEPPKDLPAGAVLDAAVAEMAGPAGKRLTAGLLVAQVRDNRTGRVVCGLVVTYSGHDEEAAALAELRRRLMRAFRRRFPSKAYALAAPRRVVKSIVPANGGGAVVAALVFSDTLYPQAPMGPKFVPLREAVSQ